MKIAFFIILAVFCFIQTQNCGARKAQNAETANVSPTPKATKFERLPDNVKPGTKVRKETRNEKGEVTSVKITTVEKRLNELKARYENEKLVDGNGREIRFFEPLCRGVPASEEQEEADRKAKDEELSELEKKYTVIILQCDPSKVM
ncbi:MAG TPA: hypothetical protein VGC76_04750 [Pyrinomonadaceae bacterium]|jgi:hypothetical protein